jgi:hypothetical protein
MNRFIGQFHQAELQIIITHSNYFNHETQKKGLQRLLASTMSASRKHTSSLLISSDFCVCLRASRFWLLKSLCQVKVKVTLRLTVSQSVSKSCCYSLAVTFLFLWGALSDERTGLSFVCAAGPCQRSLSRVLLPWDFRPYITVSDLRRPFSSPPTTRRVTVGVFDPASTRVFDSYSLVVLPAVFLKSKSHCDWRSVSQ